MLKGRSERKVILGVPIESGSDNRDESAEIVVDPSTGLVDITAAQTGFIEEIEDESNQACFAKGFEGGDSCDVLGGATNSAIDVVYSSNKVEDNTSCNLEEELDEDDLQLPKEVEAPNQNEKKLKEKGKTVSFDCHEDSEVLREASAVLSGVHPDALSDACNLADLEKLVFELDN